MKTIGLIGGMSWESTASYYRAINVEVKVRLGGLHSAKIVLVSVDFAEIAEYQQAGDWQLAAQLLSTAALSLQAAGADFFIICTNTMHNVADTIQGTVDIPMLHIADATGQQLRSEGITNVALLGTKFTMQQAFYKSRLQDKFAIDVIVPTALEQDIIHQVIYDELCLGKILDESRRQFVKIIESLHRKGAQGVILGCTEIALLVQQNHTQVRLYDTTRIHAQAAVELALS
ncbi:MAG: aspartate racemase [Paraglaciecola sp.]|jgi:aspartate racemase